MRGQAIAPEQHVGFARREAKAGIAEDAPGELETTAVAIQRLIIVVVVGFQFQRDAVSIGGCLTKNNSAHATGQENRRREAPAKRNAARRVSTSEPRRNGCSTNLHER